MALADDRMAAALAQDVDTAVIVGAGVVGAMAVVGAAAYFIRCGSSTVSHADNFRHYGSGKGMADSLLETDAGYSANGKWGYSVSD